MLHLGSTGVSTAFLVQTHADHRDERVVGVAPLGSVALEPLVVVPLAQVPVHRELEMLESSVGTVEPSWAIRFSCHLCSRSKPGLEVGLADERGPVAGGSWRWPATVGASTGSGIPFATTP